MIREAKIDKTGLYVGQRIRLPVGVAKINWIDTNIKKAGVSYVGNLVDGKPANGLGNVHSLSYLKYIGEEV